MATAPILAPASLSAELIATPQPARLEASASDGEQGEAVPGWHADLRFFLAAYAGFLMLFMLVLG